MLTASSSLMLLLASLSLMDSDGVVGVDVVVFDDVVGVVVTDVVSVVVSDVVVSVVVTDVVVSVIVSDVVAIVFFSAVFVAVTDVIIGVVVVIRGFVDFVIVSGIDFVGGVFNVIDIGVIDGGGSGDGNSVCA